MGTEGIRERLAWHPELEARYGSDFEAFLLTTVAPIATCFVCSGPLSPTDQLSVSAEVVLTPSINVDIKTIPDIQIIHNYVTHASCSEPRIWVVERESFDELVESENDCTFSRVVLQLAGDDGTNNLFPLIVAVTKGFAMLRNGDGDPISIRISQLLHHGFKIVMSPNLADLEESSFEEINSGVDVRLSKSGQLSIGLFGSNTILVKPVQIDPIDEAGVDEWTRACWSSGKLLIIFGEGFRVNADSGEFDLTSGVALGSVVSALANINLIE